jgi:hypothetical protein
MFSDGVFPTLDMLVTLMRWFLELGSEIYTSMSLKLVAVISATTDK